MNVHYARDAVQASQAFVISQMAHVESKVWEVKYPDIVYKEFVPVDYSAHPWAKTVTFTAMDGRGKAEWINGAGKDIPLVGLSREQFETPVYMAGIGYSYTIEEINTARMLGQNIDADKAKYARRAYEEKCESVAFIGDTAKGLVGLLNSSTPSRVDVPNGAATTPTWATKTPSEILTDVNAILTGSWTATLGGSVADTLLLPLAQYSDLVTRRMDATLERTLLSWIEDNNIYTKLTGQKLKIRALRQLAGLGSGGTNRMVAYRRSDEVVKMHIPLALQFLAPQADVLSVLVPGFFRIGGTDIRLPGEVRYADGI